MFLVYERQCQENEKKNYGLGKNICRDMSDLKTTTKKTLKNTNSFFFLGGRAVLDFEPRVSCFLCRQVLYDLSHSASPQQLLKIVVTLKDSLAGSFKYVIQQSLVFT
jgi:hypothetical protein